MEHNILLFSRDPGGANAIMPLIDPLHNKGHQVLLFGKNGALKKYKDEGFRGADIADSVTTIDVSALNEFLKKIAPSLVVTGTSADDMTEKFIWNAANALGIPSFAIVDQWVNYGIRFSPYSLAEIEKYNKRKEHPFLPRGIFVTDEQAKREMTRDGIPAERIAVTGNPYFEYFVNRAATVTRNRLDEIRSFLGIRKDDPVVAFASEPILSMYGQDNYLGYTEKTIVEEIINALLIVKTKSSKNITLIIRLHPKDDEGHYDDIVSKYTGKIAVVIDRTMRSYELPLISDVVCGMYSMLLIESVLLKKPIMSVQIGLKREDPFMLARTGAVRTVCERDVLISDLEGILLDGKIPSSDFNYIENPIENVMNALEGVLCQN